MWSMREWPSWMQPRSLRRYVHACESHPEHTPEVAPEVRESWQAMSLPLRVAVAAGGSWVDALAELRSEPVRPACWVELCPEPGHDHTDRDRVGLS